MPSFLQTLLRPDQDENEERSLVAQAANILEVGEFQVLQLAYHEAFDRDMSKQVSDEVFRTFMMHSQVPAWALTFAEKVLDHEARGELNDRHPYFHRYDSDYFRELPLGARRLALAICMVTLIVGGGIMVSQLSVAETRDASFGMQQKTSAPTSVLPPFWSEEELSPQSGPDLRGS